MRRKRVIELAVALAVTLSGALAAAPALGDRNASASGTKRIVVMDNFFEPRSINVHAGDRVAWIWKGANSHNVTFIKVPAKASKKGAETRKDGRWTRKFRKPGIYRYICTIHSGQRGTINVARAEPPPPSSSEAGAVTP